MNALERLACQVILIGFDGTMLDEPLVAYLRSAQFAGYLLFARNVETLEQTRRLTDALRALHAPDSPPLVAVDQEGGRIVRLREGVEPIPPMMSVGVVDDADLARRAGEQTAHDLRRAGFSIDFAPVIDLALDPMNTVIGTRSFGSDPQRVVALARAFAAGLNAGGIVATYKHFPGHGSTAIDSHLDLPVIELDGATLRARDLAPFAAVATEASAFMSAHVVMTAIDAEQPATLSHAVLTGLLRDELGFRGVCFTDCMQMGAVARKGTIDAVVAAIAAGADCALVSHDPALALAAARAIVAAVERGALSRTRLEEAVARVADLRARLAQPLPLESTAPHPSIGRTIARRAVTRLRGDASAVAAQSLVISFQGDTSEGAQGAHADHPSLCAHAPALIEMRLSLEPQAADLQSVRDAIASTGRRPILLARRAHLYPSQAEAIHGLLAEAPEALLVSLREPYDLTLFPEALHVAAAYGDDAASIAGLADVLFGGDA